MAIIPPEARKRLMRSLEGVPQAGLPDRTFTRGQGCWNCIHAKSAADHWFAKRNQKLEYAVQIALQSPQQEDDPEVVAIRRHVAMIDQGIAQGAITCSQGKTADGNPVGDFVASAFLCSQWSGRDGASLARAANGKLDELPEELRERIDGTGPIDSAAFSKKVSS